MSFCVKYFVISEKKSIFPFNIEWTEIGRFLWIRNAQLLSAEKLQCNQLIAQLFDVVDGLNSGVSVFV